MRICPTATTLKVLFALGPLLMAVITKDMEIMIGIMEDNYVKRFTQVLS